MLQQGPNGQLIIPAGAHAQLAGLQGLHGLQLQQQSQQPPSQPQPKSQPQPQPRVQIQPPPQQLSPQLGSVSGGVGQQPLQYAYQVVDVVSRMCMKLLDCRPEELPPKLRGNLQQWVETADAESLVLQGCMRPGRHRGYPVVAAAYMDYRISERMHAARGPAGPACVCEHACGTGKGCPVSWDRRRRCLFVWYIYSRTCHIFCRVSGPREKDTVYGIRIWGTPG